MSEILAESTDVKRDAEEADYRAHGERTRRARAESFKRLFTPKFIVGVGIVLVIALFGIIAPFFTQDPRAIDNVGLTGPSAEHLLGTTQVGQDVLAQLAHSTRGSLTVGVVVAALVLFLSAFFGILGAYIGGVTDEAFSLFSR